MIADFLFKRRKSAFRYPLGPAPRTALLVAWFREPRRPEMRVFAAGWDAAAAAFGPAALAGTPEQLLTLAGRDDRPRLTRALVVLARAGDGLLSTDARERLWRAFRVPVFLQIVGPRGEILAAECEAHDGLHIEMPGSPWPGYAIETAPCVCGRKAPRLATTGARERAAAG